MKNNDIGCFGVIVVLLAIAFGIWRTVEIFAADIPMWLKWSLLG